MPKENKKLAILMLAAHEPTLDPRIDWEATYAAKDFDVTVLGLQSWSSKKPESENKSGYQIQRKESSFKLENILVLFYYLLGLLPKIARIVIIIPVIVLGILLFPIFFFSRSYVAFCFSKSE